jgi:hypothetical protein
MISLFRYGIGMMSMDVINLVDSERKEDVHIMIIYSPWSLSTIIINHPVLMTNRSWNDGKRGFDVTVLSNSHIIISYSYFHSS